jgi:hypothetical protein
MQRPPKVDAVFLYKEDFFDKNIIIFVDFRGWGASNMQNSFTKTRTNDRKTI